MADTPEEMGKETVEQASGSVCRDPERLKRLGEKIGELLAADPSARFLSVAVVASYSCDRHEEGDVHAVTGLMTRAVKAEGHADLRLIVRRLRELANQLEREFPAPPGEVPYEERA